MPSRKNNGLSEDAKTLITVLLLLFAYPAGVIMMFIWMKWPTWVKIIILLPILLFIFMIVFMLPFMLGLIANFKYNNTRSNFSDTLYPINAVQHYNAPVK